MLAAVSETKASVKIQLYLPHHRPKNEEMTPKLNKLEPERDICFDFISGFRVTASGNILVNTCNNISLVKGF